MKINDEYQLGFNVELTYGTANLSRMVFCFL